MLNLILNDKICFRNSSLKSLLLFLRSGFLFFYTFIIFPNRVYFIMYLLVYIKLFNKTISFFKKITTNFKVCKPYILFRSQQVSIKSLIFWKFSENKIFFLSSLFTQISINLFFNFIFHSDFSSNVFKIKKSDNILYFRKKKEKFTDKQIRLWRCFFLFNCSEHFTKNFQKVKFPKIYLKLTAYEKMMNGFNPNDIIFIEKKNNLDFKTKNKIFDCFLKFYKKKNTKVVSIYFLIFYTLIFYLGFFFDHFYLFIGSKNDPAFRKKLRLFSDEIQRVFFLIKNILILKKFGNFILLFFEKASKKNSNNKNKTYFYFTFGEKLKKMSSCFFSRSKGKISFFPDFFVNKIVSVKTFLKKNFKILSRSSFKTLIKLKFVTWLVLFFKFPNHDFVFFSKCFSSKALSYIKNLSKFKLIFLFDKKNIASAPIFFLNMNFFSKNTFI